MDRLKIICFWIGVSMIAYDMLGHLCCAIARKNYWAANLWNSHSKKIWPSISDGFNYDIYWTVFFSIAIILLIFSKSAAGKI